LRAVINLNTKTRPPWASEIGGGPLFESPAARADPRRNATASEEIAALFTDWPPYCGQIDWHVDEHDVAQGGLRALLNQPAFESSSIGIVFDRPGQPVRLAAGVDREHPAVLLSVSVDLARFCSVAQVERGSEAFLKKLPSLARLALSAGAQKRAFLRRSLARRPGFTVDTARLLVIPKNLVQTETDESSHSHDSTADRIEFAKRTLRVLRDTLQRDARLYGLEASLDLCSDDSAAYCQEPSAEADPDPTARWSSDFIPTWLKGSATLASAVNGTLVLPVAVVRASTSLTMQNLLAFLWRDTKVARVRFAGTPRPRQLHAPWASG
jgi:hypothetical protein